MARYPRNSPRGGTQMSAKDRKEVFKISLQILELYNFMLRSDSIQQFLWGVNLQFQWHAFIFLAHELALHPGDKDSNDAWLKIEDLFENNTIP